MFSSKRCWRVCLRVQWRFCSKANNLNMQPLQEPTAWQLYRRLAVYLKGYWKVFTVAIVAMLVVAATMPLFGYLLKPLINEGFVDKNMQKMSWLPLAIVALFIVRGVFNFINEYCTR